MNEPQQQYNNQFEDRLGEFMTTLLAAQMVDILEGMNDALYTVDEHWHITYINRKTEKIWGRRREDLIGHNVWEVFPHAVGSPAYHAYFEAMQERQAITCEYFASGANCWLHARAYPSGEGLVVHLSDITERKIAEEEERERRQLAEAQRDSLAALTGSLTVGQVMQQILASAAIVVPSEAGCIILFEGNSGHVAYLRGFTPEAEAFFKEYQFPTLLTSGAPALSDKQVYFVPDTHADPTWITLPTSEWIRSSIGMPIEIRGTTIGLLIVDSATPNHFKATDMKKLQTFAHYAGLALENAQHVTQLEQKVVARTAELNEAKEGVEAILNNSLDGILLVDAALHIQQTNAAFHRLVANEPADIYYGSLYDLIHLEDVRRVQAVIETAPREPAGQQLEIRCYRKNGTLFETELSISYITAAVSVAARFVCTLRDITERKQVQNTLAEERNLLRTLIDTIPDAIYIKDINHRSRLSNIAGARTVGMTPEEIVGKDDLALFPAEMARQFQADEVQLFQSGVPLIDHEERSFGQDGQAIWASTTKVPLRNLNGEIIGLVGITRNISEQKQRENQLRYYASLQENVSDAVIATDMEFCIQSWNRAAETIYGWRADEVIGRHVAEFLPSRYIDPEQSDVRVQQTLFAQGQWEGEIRQYHKDGTELYMLSAVTLLKDEQGVPVGVVGVSHNITERKRADEALREQRDFLQLVIDSVPDLITVNDRTGLFHMVNASAAQIYGLTPADMIGKTDAELNKNPDEVNYFLQTDQAALDSEQIVLIPEQTILGRYYQTSKIPLKKLAGPPDRLLAVSFDITERKQAETALQQAFEKEQELSKLKLRFFSMASHEFRTPLTSILLMTETLSAYRHKLADAQISKRLGHIQEQVRYLKTIMEDVLQLAELEARQPERNPVRLDLNMLCRNILDELQIPSDDSQGLAYTGDTTLGEVYLDKKRMRQIITNLVSNAIKYSAPDKPVQIRLRHSEASIILQVQDQGIGIPTADLKHLFEPFQRATNVGEIAGTGLGLTIVKEAVERQGGTITVESQYGVGTTFTVSLPLVTSVANLR